MPTQALFLQDVARYKAFVGAVGAGKTRALCEAVYWLCLKYPGIRGIIGRYQQRDFERTTMKTLWSESHRDLVGVIPKTLIDAKKSAPYKGYFQLINGSEIQYAHFDAYQQFLGAEIGFFAIDQAEELDDDAVWNAMTTRLRQILPDGTRPKYYGLITSNPNGKDWIYRKFHPESKDHVSDCRIYIPGYLENAGNLPMNYYEDMIRQNSRDWVKRFIESSFDTFERQVWKEWDEKVHVIEDFTIPEKWYKTVALDEGISAPTAAVWCAWDREGNLIFYRDYYEINADVKVHADALKRLSGAERIDLWKADPHIWDTKGTRGEGRNPYCTADEYDEHGIEFEPASNSVEAGIQRVAGLLNTNLDHPYPAWHPKAGQFGAPRIYVMRSCENVRLYVPQWKWRDMPAESGEKWSNQAKHIPDVFRYTAMIRDVKDTYQTAHEPKAMTSEIARAIQRQEWANCSVKHRQGMERAAKERMSSITITDDDSYF